MCCNDRKTTPRYFIPRVEYPAVTLDPRPMKLHHRSLYRLVIMRLPCCLLQNRDTLFLPLNNVFATPVKFFYYYQGATDAFVF